MREVTTTSKSLKKSALKRVGAAFAVLVFLAGIFYALTPWIATSVASRLASRLGVNTIDLSIDHPGFAGVTIRGLEIESDVLSLVGKSGRAEYSWSNIVAGRIDELTFELLQISARQSASSQHATPSPSLEAAFESIPINHFVVKKLTLKLPDIGFTGSGAMSVSESSLSLTMDGLEPEQASRLSITADLSQDGQFSARLSERGGGAAVDFLSVHGTIAGDVMSIEGNVELSGYALKLASAFAGIPSGSGKFSSNFQTQLSWPPSAGLSLRDVVAEFPSIDVNWKADKGDLELDSVTGSLEFDDGNVLGTVSGTLRSRINESTLTVILPTDYQLRYESDILTGASGLKVRIQKATTDIATTLRSFSIETAPVTRLRFDADANGQLDAVRVNGRVESDTTLDPADANSAHGSLKYTGQIQFGEQTHQGELESEIGIRGDNLSATGTLTSGIFSKAKVRLDYNLESGEGQLEVSNKINFTKPIAKSLVPDWSADYDLDAGHIDVKARANWRRTDKIVAELDLSLTDNSGHYDDYLATGISGQLQFRTTDVEDAEAWSLLDTSIRIREIDVGFPIEELFFKLAWSDGTVNVTEARAAMLGGRGAPTAFDYDVATGATKFDLALQSIELAELLLLEGDDIQGTGLLDGQLPVIIENNQARVEGGKFGAQPPGGLIRLTPAFSGPTGQAGLDFALLALKDFNYSKLVSEVDYAENGDLRLAVHLTGHNPEVENGRTIQYNLNISENIPVLLESLRVQDRVTDTVEKNINK